LTGSGSSGRIDPIKYLTPCKQAVSTRLHQDSPSKDSWEGVSKTSLPGVPEFVSINLTTLASPALGAGKDINVKQALQALQENFSTLGEHLTSHLTLLKTNLVDMIPRRLDLMAIEGSMLGRRIGEPAGFGEEEAVSTAFDGLRFLHEQIETVKEPFSKVSFASVVDKLGRVESDLVLL
jgi:hypothetical protein